MVTAVDATLFKEIFRWGILAGQEWIVPLFITFMVMVLISRKTSDWGSLFLPVLVGLKIVGVNFVAPYYMIFVTAGAISFIINGLSLEVIGNTIKAGITGTVKSVESFVETSKRRKVGKAAYTHTRKTFEEQQLPSYIASQLTQEIGPSIVEAKMDELKKKKKDLEYQEKLAKLGATFSSLARRK